MTSHRTVFNHVGLCVADCARSRRFYEGLLGFEFWWELEPPDDGTDQLLQLDGPIGLHATYLVRDGLVLELLDYTRREVRAGPDRVMDQLGLTHLSLSVSDLPDVLALVDGFGGSVVEATVSEESAMIRDPDGQLLELLSDEWLAVLPPRPPTEDPIEDPIEDPTEDPTEDPAEDPAEDPTEDLGATTASPG
jgi:lactoylglutathione lyase